MNTVSLLMMAGTLPLISSGETCLEVVAHRGLWVEAGVPQNTVEAIRAAYESGARTVETDFVETESGEIICLHDVKALATMSSIVVEPKTITAADRARINLGDKAGLPRPYRIPLLNEVLAVVPKDRMLQAEIKVYGPTYAEKFDAAVKAAGLAETNIVVSSFRFDALADFHRRYPRYRTLWLGCDVAKGLDVEKIVARARQGGFDVVCPGAGEAKKAGFTRADADRIRAAGFDFRLYGVNSLTAFKFAVAMGASAFTCNTFLKAYTWAGNLPDVRLLPVLGRNETGRANLFPADVKTVGLVSVSSLISKSSFIRGTNLLAEAGYRVKVMPNVRAAKVAAPKVRARLFEEAWLDPEVDILLFARGGHGALDVVDKIDWAKLAKRNMRVIGFSDVTAVLNAMAVRQAGHPYLGPMLSTLTTYCSEESKKRMRRVLEGAQDPIRLEVVKSPEGAVSGRPVGGLLDRFVRLGEKGLRPSAQGRIVFLENTPRYADKGEAMLDRLIEEDAFKGAAAVVFCDFNNAWPKERVRSVFGRFADRVDCPVFAGYPFGHVPESYTIDFLRTITISKEGLLK